MFIYVIICLWKCSYAHSRLWSFIRTRICACTCMWIRMCVYVDAHTYINIYASDYTHCVVSVYICFMSPCVCMVRDNWTVAGCSPMWTHSECTWYKRTKWYIPGLLPKDWTLLGASSSIFYLFFIFISGYGHFLLNESEYIFHVCIFISCMPTVILLHRLILCFRIGQNWPQ